VRVDFRATWRPSCRKEIPDLSALYRQFANQGLVIPGISAETAEKVASAIDMRTRQQFLAMLAKA
jgi:peroxiredoxin